jgi:hypothetical protein
VLLIAFAAARLASTWQLGPVYYPDTASYFTLGGVRLPTVPLVWKLLGSDQLRVLGQIELAVASWGLLALAVAKSVKRRWLSLGGAAAVLLLGLTVHVTQWDRIMLSESISISLSVLLLAAVLQLVRRPGRWIAVATVCVLVAWCLCRQVNVLLLIALLPFALVVLAWRLDRRQAAAGGAVLLAIAAIGFAMVAHDHQIWRFNAFYIVSFRVLPSHSDTRFFEGRGLPVTPLMRRATQSETQKRSECEYSPTCPPLGFDLDPRLARWIRRSFRSTDLAFLVDHPAQAVADPLANTDTILKQPLSYAGAREIVPAPRDDELVFALLVVAALSYAAALVRTGFRPADLVPLGGIGTGLVWYELTWNLSATELPRLVEPVAVIVALSSVILTVTALDRLEWAR